MVYILKHLIKEYKELLLEFSGNILKFLKYEFITKGILSFIVIPLFGILSQMIFSRSSVLARGDGSVLKFIASPSGFFFVLLMMITIIAELMIEIMGYITISCKVVSNAPESTFLDILKYNLKVLPRMISVGGIIILLYIILLSPVSGLGFHVKFMGGLEIAKIIKDAMRGNIILSTIYWIIVLITLYLSFKFIFVFNFMIVHDQHAGEALSNSWRLVKKNRKKFAVDLVAISVFNIIFSLLAVAIWLIFVVAVSKNINTNFAYGRIIMAFLLVLQNIGIFIITSLYVPFEAFHITKAYYEFVGKENERCPVIKASGKRTVIDRLFSRKRRVIAVILLASALISIPIGVFTREALGYNENIKVFAQNGYGEGYPPGSEYAVKESIKEKINYVQLELYKRADGKYAVYTKDENVGNGIMEHIENQDMGGIQNADTGGESAKRAGADNTMTLNELLDLCEGKINIDIQLKNDITEKDIDNVMSIIKSHNMVQSVIISSKKIDKVNYIEEKDRLFRTGLIDLIGMIDLNNIKADYMIISKEDASEEVVDEIDDFDKKVIVYDVNNEEDIEKFSRMEIYGIITDKPVLAKNTVKGEKYISEKDLLLSSFLEGLTETGHH